MLGERREARIPLRADEVEPSSRLAERCRIRPIDRVPALAPSTHETGLLESCEMLRNRLPCDRELARELRRRGGAEVDKPFD